MAVLGGRARIFSRYGRKERKPARCPAPHFEAWKLGRGAKVTGRIKMAETSACGATITNLCHYVGTIISGQLQGILIRSILIFI